MKTSVLWKTVSLLGGGVPGDLPGLKKKKNSSLCFHNQIIVRELDSLFYLREL